MVHDDVHRAVADQQEEAVPSPARLIETVKLVVQYPDPLRQPARACVVVAGNIDRGRNVADHVELERHILDHRPRRLAAFAARCHDDGVARLRTRPVALENIPFDQDAARVLQFEQILDVPLSWRQDSGRVTLLPRNTTSEGTIPEMPGSAPPSMKFSPAASR